MRDEVVNRRRWMTDAEFLDLQGATNLILGPNSNEMAIHIGHQRAGWPGLIVAGGTPAERFGATRDCRACASASGGCARRRNRRSGGGNALGCGTVELSMRRFALLVAFASLTAAATVYEQASAAYARAEADAVVAIYRGTPPQSARDHALLGKALFLNGDVARAAAEFAKAVEAEPGNSEYQLWLGRAVGRRAEQASPFAAPALAVQTRKHFERAVELDSKNVEALSDLFDYYLNAPGFLGGGESKASLLIPKVRAITPAQAQYLEAKLAEKRKDWAAAESALKRAVAAAPDEPGRKLDLAEFYAKRGRASDAEAVFETVPPDYPPLLFARAKTLIEGKRNLDKARAMLKRYLTLPLTPDYPTRREAEMLLAKIP
jgi:Flp pilus assembly protein TadD